jgi:hypothetical protein
MAIADVIFCEDVREEKNGKLIVIGIFSTSITFVEFPASAVLSLWIRIIGLPAGDYPNDLSLSVNGEVQIVLPGRVVSDGSEVTQAFAHSLQLNFPAEGLLEVTLSGGTLPETLRSTLQVGLAGPVITS